MLSSLFQLDRNPASISSLFLPLNETNAIQAIIAQYLVGHPYKPNMFFDVLGANIYACAQCRSMNISSTIIFEPDTLRTTSCFAGTEYSK